MINIKIGIIVLSQTSVTQHTSNASTLSSFLYLLIDENCSDSKFDSKEKNIEEMIYQGLAKVE